MSARAAAPTDAAFARALDLFLRDAARWVRPEQIADRHELSVVCVLRLLVTHPSLRAMAHLRLASWANERGVRGVPGYLRRRMQRVYGLELDPRAAIGGGLYVAHPVGCTLIVDAMGENVSVMGNVTIGRLEVEQWPRIGDRVFIGAGARVLGPIVVGDDARIGANSVVLRDVAPASTVVGVPAREI